MNILEALVKLRNDLKTWVANNLRTKVDKEEGKGLSTNDYTDVDKAILSTIGGEIVLPKTTLTYNGVDGDGYDNSLLINNIIAGQEYIVTVNNNSIIAKAFAAGEDANGYVNQDAFGSMIFTVPGLIDKEANVIIAFSEESWLVILHETLEVGVGDTFTLDIKQLAAGSIEVDAELDNNSENPVQNKVIKSALDTIQANTAEAITNITVEALKYSEISTAELNYLKGITSSIQEQLNSKSGKFTTLEGYGITDAASKAYVEGLIEGLTTEGTADANVVQANLTAHIAESNPHNITLGKLDVTATSTELNYISGTTSNIQNQLNALNSTKADKSTVEAIDVAYKKADAELAASIAALGTDKVNVSDIDSELSDSSVNPVQNKIVKAELDKKLEAADLADYYTKEEVDQELTRLELPVATADTLGGIKVGTGLKITDQKLSVDVIDNLTSDSTTQPLSAAQGKALNAAINSITTDLGNLGGGDMLKATYDKNNDGIVDSAEYAVTAGNADNADKLDGYHAGHFAVADNTYAKSEVDAKLATKSDSSHGHTITAEAEDDKVIILEGTSGTNGVKYKATHVKTNKADTYTKVTVNDFGHITDGSTPNEIADLGITNVYTKSEVDSKVAEEIGKIKIPEMPEINYPVTSVNGKTGAVTLGATDVHALPDTTPIPSVEFTQVVTEGTHIGTITIDNVDTRIYAPTAGESVVYEHPAHEAHDLGLYKVTVDNQGHVTEATKVVKEDITALGIPGQDTKVVNVTLPMDRIYGDVDGDGFITEADSSLILGYYTDSVSLSELQLALSDTSGDGKYNSADAMLIVQYLEGRDVFTPNTYYGNWIYDSVNKNYYYDIQITDMSTSKTAIVLSNSSFINSSHVTGVINEGSIRLYTNLHPPLEEVKCSIIYRDGDGSVIIGSSYSNATLNNDGLMSSEDKIKLDNIKESNIVTITLPADLMAGDMDGDGDVDTDDAIYLLYNVQFGEESYPIKQNRDLDGNGVVNTDDSDYLLYNVGYGHEDYPIDQTTYYNRWIYSTERKAYYYDAAIENVSAGYSAIITFNDNSMNVSSMSGECRDGVIRVYVENCPLADVVCTVVYGPGDGSVQFINGKPKPGYIGAAAEGHKHVIKDISGLQTQLDSKSSMANITVPAYRMLGDVDGDGKIDSYDVTLVMRHAQELAMLSGASLWAADVNKDGIVDASDYTYIQRYGIGDPDYPIPAEYYDDNWAYSTSKELYYYDVAISGMTNKYSAIVTFNDATVDSDVSGECINDAIRIYFRNRPINNITGIVTYGIGDGSVQFVNSKLSAESIGAAELEHTHSYKELEDKPNITEDDSDNLSIADEAGNIVLKIGELDVNTTGLETTTIIAQTAEIGNVYSKEEVDAKLSKVDTLFTYGTEDLVAGESKLETGKLYFVYE